MNILETIIKHKKELVEEAKILQPTIKLEKSIFFESNPVSLKHYIQRENNVGIIAEIKRRSPSKGMINERIDVEQLSIAYMQSGASALSVLTDNKFFGGSNEDLQTARKFNYCPILRKDFIVDEYQIIEAKSIGADCILLIAACLNPQDCKSLAAFAKSLNMEVLLEVRTKEEINTHTNQFIDIIGVNNRDLTSFKTHINNSLELYNSLPNELMKISESGITDAKQIKELKSMGYNGFLIGGYFMQHDEPARICKSIIENYKTLCN